MTEADDTNAKRRAVEHVAARSSGMAIDASARVTLHFHPDRYVHGVPILQAMQDAGRYKSQFETGTSNGGLTAHPGGDRWRWESRLFGGAYDDQPASSRPVYGSLNYRNRPFGGSPRFGSSYFRLSANVLPSTTLCFPDSVFDPVRLGVPATASTLVDEASVADLDALDDYIEAHVHIPGGVRFDSNVEALVLDPCFEGTEVEELARRFPHPIEWHPGFRISVDVLLENVVYRGQEIVDCGLAIARDGWLDASIVGEVARTGDVDLQVLKKVWHYIARFGESS